MKKYNGSMMAYLNERTQGAAAEASDRSEIQMIDFHQLIPNTKNFYGIREIEQLAHSMALSGTVEPLLVVRITSSVESGGSVPSPCAMSVES